MLIYSLFFRADEMDEYDDYPPSNRKEQFVLPTAPRAARGPDISDDRIPRDPPFTAYVANLSYDVEEQHIMDFFSKLKVKPKNSPQRIRNIQSYYIQRRHALRISIIFSLLNLLSLGQKHPFAPGWRC